MHIKKLEINGFKSFVDKTVVHFDHDVIGIVGPNGCGKSNVVDAIRWCMGEQSARHLRGRSMEDIIFNGSESRPQHGMAEVTLTFDNTDQAAAVTLPEAYREYPEIAVTRRLYRDGTSEYLLNKTQVRLRDVTDLFLGTGVGTKAYSIVEQGRIGQIVSSRPQDRRSYIEEAAGITKYRLRRKQAERKMQLTRQNLLRVTDIVNEIDRTRNSLKRQAAKAERYLRYREELEDLFLHDASHRLLGMLAMEKHHDGNVQGTRQSSIDAQAALTADESALQRARQEASSIEEKHDNASQRLNAAEQRNAELKGEQERNQDRSVHLQERLESGRRERDGLAEKLTSLRSEKAELEALLASLTEKAESQSTAMDQTGEHLGTLRAKESAAEEALKELQSEFELVNTELIRSQAKEESLTQNAQEHQLRREQLVASAESSCNELVELREQSASIDEAARALDESVSDAARRSTELAQQAEELGATLQQQDAQLDALRGELNLKESRLKVLTELHRRLEGVGGGTKALLSSGSPAVVGMLADRLQVSERGTSALAGLLGERLQCVIVEDPQQGLALLEKLGQKQGGRATIATRRPAFVIGTPTGAEDDPRVLGRLLDELSYQSEDEALIRALVGDALLVDDASSALELNRNFPGATLVALDGTVVREGGLISGGSGDQVAAAMVEQKREIAELETALLELNTTLSTAAEEKAIRSTAQATLRGQLEESQRSRHELELKQVSAKRDATQHLDALKRLESAEEQAKQQLEQLDRQSASGAQELAQIAQSLTELRGRREELKSEKEAAETRFKEARETASEQAAVVMDRKVRLAQLTEQLDGARSAMARVDAHLGENESRQGSLRTELNQNATALGELGARRMATREEQQLAQRTLEDSRESHREIRSLLEEIRSGLGTREGTLRQARVTVAELEESVRVHEMALQKVQLEREHLLGNVAERFRGLELDRVVGDYHMRPAPDAEHRRRIDELTKLIDRMGPVNLDAKQEWDDAELRFTELNDQKVDIEQSLTELERAIRHMDRESKRRFRESFDEINRLFKASFTRLFKGGRGELKLTDPENLLETGVDIIAQPPGKKLGNIELMSGGEKALTATALIFAIFEHRPSPFCILDEVDAPLDEANVSRYNEAIRAMTDNSQFIIITHIKRTMQSVDVLYGVTMGEPGVSRIVSVKVNEAAARSARSPSALEPSARAAAQTEAPAAGQEQVVA